MEESDASSGLGLSFRQLSQLLFASLIGCLLFLSGCGGKDAPPELPFLEVEDDVIVRMYTVEYLFSDSAILQAKMTAGRVTERAVEKPADAYHELAGGVRIDMYDYYGRTTGIILADSAIFYDQKNEAVLYDQVVLRNKKRETMQTDSIVWSQEKDSIYTQAPVHITTSAQEIFARDGLRAKADFSTYVLYGTSGEVEIDEDES